MLLIWGRIVIDVMDHLAGSIDHMVRQRFYQSGGISAPSPAVEGGTKWHFGTSRLGQGYGAGDRSSCDRVEVSGWVNYQALPG
jgi:hypothetical protein